MLVDWGLMFAGAPSAERASLRVGAPSRLLTPSAVTGGRRFTPGYTARMGHWDFLVDHFANRLPAGADRSTLLAAAQAAGAEIEMLAGQSFGPLKRHSVSTDTFGMPFVEVPGILVGSEEGPSRVRPIPSPVDPRRAFVAQVAEFKQPPARAMAAALALRSAGAFVHVAATSGLLSGAHILTWLEQAFPLDERTAFFREVGNDSYHAHLPVVVGESDGWWFQITRRVLRVTEATQEMRLVEPLIRDGEGALRGLAAVEPLLIIARITEHPVDWAMAVRIWPSVERPAATKKGWRVTGPAIHDHGMPILSLDPESTPEELGCQLLLLAFWHKYVSRDDPELADAIASAYPEPVRWIARATAAPDTRAAAAMLFEGLLRPGFDPSMGAAAARRYVARKASIAIRNHRKAADGGLRTWEALGVSERRYYKLLRQFASKNGGGYEVDQDVLDRIRSHLASRDQATELHTAAMAVLQERGFSYDAARKWLQRHEYSEALRAQPRPKRKPRDSGS